MPYKIEKATSLKRKFTKRKKREGIPSEKKKTGQFALQ